MKLTTIYGQNIFLAWAERATILVSHQHLPSREMTNQSTRHAMTTIIPDVPDKCADSHTNAANVLGLVTPNLSLQDHPHLAQLQEQTFKPVTPVQVDNLKCLLQGHPNHKLVQNVVDGFHFGISLKYNGPRVSRQSRNLPTAYTHSDLLWQSVMKEANLGRMLGPFDVQAMDHLPYHTFQSSSGSSINSFI